MLFGNNGSGVVRMKFIISPFLLENILYAIILKSILKYPYSVKFFRRRMHNYATLRDKFMQHYVVRGDISPHFRRHIAVNDRFCGDNLIGI